ncbi:MAG: glycosyltransferase [Candidatus Micrarchaeota archaeon]|nr:glycosyltransferase [Candidatus Micrarchaeota archaeon]
MKGKKVNLTIITNSLYTFGGGERWALEVATKLANDYNVTILNQVTKKDTFAVSLEGLNRQYDLSAVNLIDLDCSGIKLKAFGTDEYVLRLPTLRVLGQLARNIKKSDIVYCISFNPVILYATILLCRAYRKKLIYAAQNFVMFRKFEGPNTISKSVIAKTINSIPNVHAPLLHIRDKIKKMGYKGKLFYLPNFLYFDTDPKNVRVNENEFEVIFVGRLSTHVKGIDLLENVINRVLLKKNKIKFKIIGEGKDGEEIVKRLVKKYPHNVSWKGFLNDVKLKQEYMQGSLLIIPTRYMMFTLSLLEAQSYGLPSIAFKFPDYKDAKWNEKLGTLVEPYESQKFAMEIIRYYEWWKRDKGGYLKRKRYIANYVEKVHGYRVVIPKIKKMFDPKKLNG